MSVPRYEPMHVTNSALSPHMLMSSSACTRKGHALVSSPVLKEEYESVHPPAADDPGVVGFLFAVSTLLSCAPSPWVRVPSWGACWLPWGRPVPGFGPLVGLYLSPLARPPGFGIHTQVSCNIESLWQWSLWLKPLYLASVCD